MSDDEKAREAKAQRLHEEIEQMKPTAEAECADVESETPKTESPRDFIQRRMRELEQGKGKKKNK